MTDPVLPILDELRAVDRRIVAARTMGDAALYALALELEETAEALSEQLRAARATTPEGLLAQIEYLFFTHDDLIAFLKERVAAAALPVAA